MISLILKVQNNQKIKYEEQFPSIYDVEYNANNERNVKMALRELQKYPLKEIRKQAQEMGLTYVISKNLHNNKWGLNDHPTSEGGGIIAQSDSYEGCIERAEEIFGIHRIFIIGVDVDGF